MPIYKVYYRGYYYVEADSADEDGRRIMKKRVCNTCKRGEYLKYCGRCTHCKNIENRSAWEPKGELIEQDQRLTDIERDEILKNINFFKSEISRMKSERIEIISRHMVETSRYKLELLKSQERERKMREKLKKEQNVKAEAVKEFAKRLKTALYVQGITDWTVDGIIDMFEECENYGAEEQEG